MSDREVEPKAHDRLLDAIRSVAIVRVILWHTWSWAWLSWIPAMPTMFFTNGALLEMSLERRGWATTVRQRARRLLIPYWFYGVVCWVAMLSHGWHPRVVDGLSWFLPLADPVGSDILPGLWIPLWYIRAYIWFVVLSGFLKWLVDRLGMWTVVGSATCTVGLWAWSYAGHEVPFAVGDAVGYLPFVLAGMVYRSAGRLGGRRILGFSGVLTALAAGATWKRFGPADAIVNRSYLLMLLVGGSGIMLAVALRPVILRLLDRSDRTLYLVKKINSRALTIYLWQGFGLVAADRLVQSRFSNRFVVPLLSIVVVAAVVFAAALAFGPLEDVAARRIAPRDLMAAIGRRFNVPGYRLVRSGVSAGALVVVVLALVLPVPQGRSAEAPLSGNAVVTRAGMVEDSLISPDRTTTPATVAGGGGTTQSSPKAVIERWLDENRSELADLDLHYIEASLAAPDGTTSSISWGETPGAEDPLAWWSMTKTVTAAWLMRLVEAGVVSLDDRLAKWVPEVPNARRITLEQLARHTSGIPGELDSGLFDSNPREQIQEYKDSPELAFAPGKGFSYSRTGYILLGLALERASGVTWTGAVRRMAAEAGATIGFDEDRYPNGEVTDPDGHGYRGNLWSSGGIVSSTRDAAKFLRWIFTEGLEPSSIDAMTSFSADPQHWFYGLGLMPVCPCSKSDGNLHADRFGLDSATGSFAVDRGGAVVVLRPSEWFRDDSPVKAFYDLENRLLDTVASSGGN